MIYPMERTRLAAIILLALGVVEYSSALSCYSFDGFEYPDQQICPGTSQCCGVKANCTTNRLCDNEDEPEGTFVRGPCAVRPWDPEKCAAVCLYDEQPQGGVFPRVTVCNDGSYCCNNDSACCANGRGVFLDRAGNLIEKASASSTPILTSTPSSMAATSSSLASTSVFASSNIPSPTSALSTSSESLSHRVKVGLGVGVSLGIVIIAVLAVIAWLLWRKRQRSQSSPIPTPPQNPFEQPPFYSSPYPNQDFNIKESDRYQYSHELPSDGPPRSPQELDSLVQPK